MPQGAKKRRFTMRNFKVIIANNAAALRLENPTHTVEAEYGLDVVEGSVLTLAHHGPRVGNPCPCLGDSIPYEGTEPIVIGVSHFDLDTLGGVLRIVGQKYSFERLFWKVAALVDTMGVHKLEEIREILIAETYPGSPESPRDGYWLGYDYGGGVVPALNMFWAWSEDHRLFAPRDGSVLDCTEFFGEALQVLQLMLYGDIYDAGYSELAFRAKEWVEAKEALDTASKRFAWGEDPSYEDCAVILREADCFTNHLYNNMGRVFHAVVGFNTQYKSVTLSLGNPVDGINCCEIAQQLWGPEAGGHAGIAGSPRGKEMGMDAAHEAARTMVAALRGVSVEAVGYV